MAAGTFFSEKCSSLGIHSRYTVPLDHRGKYEQNSIQEIWGTIKIVQFSRRLSMVVRCPACGTTGQASTPGQYRCPKCGTVITVSENPPQPPPIPPLLFQPSAVQTLLLRKTSPKTTSAIVSLAGLGHLILGSVLAWCLSSYWIVLYTSFLPFYFLATVAICTFWGCYAPYRLVQLTGKTFDGSIFIYAFMGSLLGVGIFLFLLEIPTTSSEPVPLGFRDTIFAKKTISLGMLLAGAIAGMYLGSVVGFFGKLAEYYARKNGSSSP